jgi:hypothetical protein
MKSDEVTVPLARPIQAHGEEIRHLTLREPTGKDLRLIGMPFEFTQAGSTRIDAAAMAKAIVHLAGIPLSSYDKLSAADVMAATMAVMGFFGEAPAGLRLAGVAAPVSIATSGTVQAAAATAAAGVALQPIVDAVIQAVPALVSLQSLSPWIAGAVVLGVAAHFIAARMQRV